MQCSCHNCFAKFLFNEWYIIFSWNQFAEWFNSKKVDFTEVLLKNVKIYNACTYSEKYKNLLLQKIALNWFYPVIYVSSRRIWRYFWNRLVEMHHFHTICRCFHEVSFFFLRVNFVFFHTLLTRYLIWLWEKEKNRAPIFFVKSSWRMI